MKKVPRPVELQELEDILERTRAGALSPQDQQTLKMAIDTLTFLTHELESKGTSVERLRRLLFGPSTETTRRVLGEALSAAKADKTGPGTSGGEEPGEKAKRPGHGRNGVAAYRGAEKVKVEHASLKPGIRCPACERGKVYLQPKPESLLRVTGMAPLQASVYELERLRCNLCGQVFTAEPPEGVGTAKYDESATAMIALLKYGCGLPFHRLEKLEGSLGLPLPAATQWEVVRDGGLSLQPVYGELIRQAAQGTVVYNDDTTMKVLSLEGSGEERKQDGVEEGGKSRSGVFTSGIVSTAAGQQVALYFTGHRHAGENLEALLSQRAGELSPPIQMCDALSVNTTGKFETILANCLAHGRRQFVNVTANFPEECGYVLKTLGEVYRNDALAAEQGLSPTQRLALHQERSGPLMGELEEWLRLQIEEHRVEPNSGLGDAIKYMRKHWAELTLFLRQPGAPLDNNLCERALKKAILHRKNSLFYKTENGARVGDLYMSFIHTVELNQGDPFHYLVTVLRNAAQAAQNPTQWMPWNYPQASSGLSSPSA